MEDSTVIQEQELRSLSRHPSAEKRGTAFEMFSKLRGAEHFKAAMVLFQTPYRDLWESILEDCTSERVSEPAWRDELLKWVSSGKSESDAGLRQAVMVCIRRLSQPLEEEFVKYCLNSLNDKDADVRYQAYCLAEVLEVTSDDYLDHVKAWLESDDMDFRIVSVQAIRRIKPGWGLALLKKRAERATGEELFQVMLAEMDLAEDDSLRQEVGARLTELIWDGRFAFAAIQSLLRYRISSAVPELVRLSKRFWVDSTVRVAAAGAAAAMGSEDGRKILVKFATSGRGNPEYADQLLTALRHGEEVTL